MKKKIKNILKYISLAIVGAFIFMFGLSAQAETKYGNIILNNINNIKLYNAQNQELYTTNRASILDINGITMMSTSYGYDIEGQNPTYLNINLKQPQTINTTNKLQVQHFGYNNEFLFYYGNNLIKTIVVEGASGQLFIYGFEQEITFDKIQIKDDGQEFMEDSPLFAITSIEYNSYYNEGYQDAYIMQQQKIDALNEQNQILQNQYNNLRELYNGLAENEYTFENLFWSVGSVPMAFLLQSFNVNVLGLNIRAIITGLITALIIIWLIKRLIK